jgi:hypothetical protein
MNALHIVDTLLEADEIDPSELIHRSLGQNKYERWVFTDAELNDPKSCKGTDIFLAFPRYKRLTRTPETGGRGVRTLRNGTVTDKWEDGTGPVPRSIKRLADFEEILVALDRSVQAWNWRDVITDNTGQFIRFPTQGDPLVETVRL